MCGHRPGTEKHLKSAGPVDVYHEEKSTHTTCNEAPYWSADVAREIPNLVCRKGPRSQGNTPPGVAGSLF
eukprot:c19980_g1_i3 orf=1-207(-)